jgi:hypothetical protein
MATKGGPKTELPDPAWEVVHVQVKPRQTVRFDDHAYGEHATLQVRRRDLDRLDGDYVVVDPAADAADPGLTVRPSGCGPPRDGLPADPV